MQGLGSWRTALSGQSGWAVLEMSWEVVLLAAEQGRIG
jgi:hypothetical protein